MDRKRNDQLAGSKKKENTERILMNKYQMRKGFAIFGAAFVLAAAAPGINPAQLEEDVVFASTMGARATHPFLDAIIPPASRIAHENDLYASVMMAQAILESGWGTSRLASPPSHNLFGIKGDYQGESVNMKTLEDSGGQNYYSIKANFRQYPSYTESLEDYATLLRTGTNWDPLFYSGTWKSNTRSYTDATSHLTGRYATDTAYDTKLNAIIEKNNLTAYDTPAALATVKAEQKPNQSVAPEPTSSVVNPVKVVSSATSESAYTVKNGDTLWAISGKHGLSLQELKVLNQLSGDMIYPGQKLLVKTTLTRKDPVQAPAAVEPIVEPAKDVTIKLEGSYKVQNGDTLWSISQKQGTTVSKLKEWNQLSSEVIYPGQVLRFAQSGSKPAVAETPAPAAVGQAQEITVASGDTLYSLANRAEVSLQQLKEWNQLSSEVIYPGQVLHLTQSSSKSAVAETPAPAAVGQAQEIAVASGDTLYSLANRAGVSLQQLKAANGLTSNVIYPGQALIVPGSASVTKEVNPVSSNKAVQTIEQEVVSHSYQVQKDDTLYSIANRAGVTVAELKAANSLQDETIFVGQTLKFQAEKAAAVESPAPVSIPVTSSSNYQVQKGDTLYSIANRAGVTVAELKAANSLQDETIFVGQTLKFQAGKAVVVETPTPAATHSSYQVQKGDTLYNIANRSGVSVADLKAANNLQDETIFIGQTVKLQKSIAPAQKPAPAAYQVQKGDTAYSIARHNGLSVEQLLQLNGMTSSTIYPGQSLRLK